jgi:hypothetical protein
VGYGRVTPEGRLPVFSCDTEEEARQLIIRACPRDEDGNYYARELVDDQTLENLVQFSDKLQECWDQRQAFKVRA